MEAYAKIEIPIPAQKIEDISGDDDLVALVTLSLVVQAIVAVALSVSFKFLWAMLHTVQILVFMRLVDIWPSNATTAMKMMNSAITLDVIVEPTLEYLLEYSSLSYDSAHKKINSYGVGDPKALILVLGVFSIALILMILGGILYGVLIFFFKGF
jgi:hypothetical protein